jgi:hypothetical protein
LATSVKSPKMRPITKHINTKYHHFRQQVQEGRIVIEAIGTEDMLADILTKVVNGRNLIKVATTNHGLVTTLDARGSEVIRVYLPYLLL